MSEKPAGGVRNGVQARKLENNLLKRLKVQHLISKLVVVTEEGQRQVQPSLSRFLEQTDTVNCPTRTPPPTPHHRPSHSNKVKTGGARRHHPPPFASDASQVGQLASAAEEKVGCESRWA